MFDGESRRAKIILAAGLVTALFLWLFMQAVGGLIGSDGTAQPDLSGDLVGAVGAARNAASTTSPQKLGSCTTSRGPLPDTTCTPTPAQVSSATGIPVPPTARNFSSTYEQFQDWHLDAAFEVTDPTPYLGLADFPGLRVGGGPVQANQSADGSYRTLELTAQTPGTVLVKLSAFTT